ncbi:MAG: glycosyltransferase [Alphaproteobacteria bacterium]|nr:glycosyltransferase [Alphaproteobacteria bacterium]
MNIAFYSPMKAPDDLIPSGDREMAGLLISACGIAGHEVEIASTFRAFESTGDPVKQEMLRQGAEREADRLIARYRARGKDLRPNVWFSYHVYYKSPDWIGPRVAKALGVPYVVAEASYAASRADGPWAIGHKGAELAIKSADLIFSMTNMDAEGIDRILLPGQRHHDLPPFLDPRPYANARRKTPEAGAPARLLAVGMMRPGDKLESYRRLAEYLSRLQGQDWTLTVVGDGNARAEVVAALTPLGAERLLFRGARQKIEMPDIYANADIYVWPAAGEAYGMALLEAQASGLPVVAGRVRGVPDVMLDGQTGFLTPEGDADAFAGVIDFLMSDREARQKMGDTARRFAANMRSMEKAAVILNAGLNAVCPDQQGGSPSLWRRLFRRRGNII